MKISDNPTAFFLGLCVLLCLGLGGAYLVKHPPAADSNELEDVTPIAGLGTSPRQKPTLTPPTPTPEPMKVMSNVILEYEHDNSNPEKVLKSNVNFVTQGASLVGAIDLLMRCSPKTCRIECRQMHPAYLKYNMIKVPVGTVLESIGSISRTRLWVLPSKIILAPVTALTSDEKQKAHTYISKPSSEYPNWSAKVYD